MGRDFMGTELDVFFEVSFLLPLPKEKTIFKINWRRALLLPSPRRDVGSLPLAQ